MKRRIITTLIIAAVLAGIILLLQRNKSKNEAETAEAAITNPKVAVRTDTATNQSVNLGYLANGTFEPFQQVTVSAETNGRVVRVLVDEGARVSPGQTLAVIEGDKLNINLANAEASYNNAKADLARFESSYKTGGVTKQQLDQVRLQYENAKNNLRSAKINAGDVTIKSSISGIISSKKIEPGTYVNSGTAAFDIVNVNTLKLRVNVDEKNVAPLKVGQPVEVSASVYPNNSYTGRITFISPVADGSLNFPVEVEVRNNANNELRAGMYGTAKFGVGANADLLVIPRTAFVGSVSDNKVFVVKEGKAYETKVNSGRNFGNYIEVVSGLQANDVVVISGQLNLLDGTEVEVIK